MHQPTEGALRRILVQDPSDFAALNNSGAVLLSRGAVTDAALLLSRAVAVAPLRAEPWACLANVAARVSNWSGAVAAARRAAILLPADPDVHALLGEAWAAIERFGDAARTLRHAVALAPDNDTVRWRLGLALLEENRLAEAMAQLVPTLVSGAASSTLLVQAGIAFYNKGLMQQAQDFFDLALGTDPTHVTAAWYKMTSLLPQVARSQDEIDRQRAAYGAALGDMERLCAENPDVAATLARAPLPLPFYLPYQGQLDRDLQQRLGRLWCRVMASHPAAPTYLKPRPRRHRKTRIGIVSGFFRLHSNWKIPIKGWLDGLDRQRFALFGYYTDGRIDDHTGAAAKQFDRFVQGPLDLSEWIARIVADRLDLLLFPEIGMDPTTGRLAGLRLAPVQCASWGHPQTSGMPTIDYFLSSDLMEGDNAQAHYSEELVRLPNLSLCYHPDHLAEIESVERGDLGLADDAVLYWCCQNLSKYLPRHDDVFPRIAQQVPEAKFLFLDDPAKREGNGVFRARLHDAFARHGLDWRRHCLFLPRLSQPRFLGVTRLADVFLDAIGWSGCNSVLDALAFGLPVVTLPGAFMRGRHAAAILRQLGFTDGIAMDEPDYVDRAVRLGQSPALRRDWRDHIAQRRERLFGDAAPVRALADFFEHAVTLARQDWLADAG